MSENLPFYCSFCGKSQHEVKSLIAGPMVFICDECVELCRDIVGADRIKLTTSAVINVPDKDRTTDAQ